MVEDSHDALEDVVAEGGESQQTEIVDRWEDILDVEAVGNDVAEDDASGQGGEDGHEHEHQVLQAVGG